VEISHLEPIPRAEHRRREAERRHLLDEAVDEADAETVAAKQDRQAPKGTNDVRTHQRGLNGRAAPGSRAAAAGAGMELAAHCRGAGH
jgi:hypothetical protein